MSLKQIKIAQCFVSCFIYKTDATFNTNSLKLLLSIIVSINNYSKTFSIIYCYISSKSATSFRFIANQLSDLAFNNYPKATIIVRDFFKGLRAICTVKAALNLSLTKIVDKPFVCLLKRDKELLEVVEVIVYKISNML